MHQVGTPRHSDAAADPTTGGFARPTRWIARLAAVAVSTLASILIVEAALWRVYDPADFLRPAVVPDEVLGHRIYPSSAGHDALGFRNRTVPKHASIVAVGDSQTYGITATAADAWPTQLARKSGRSVYNMGLGGYCTLDYLHLIEHVLPRFSPDLVVVGCYFGNDFLECHTAVHRQGRHARFATNGIQAPAERSPSLAPKQPQSMLAWARGWLARHSMLYGLVKSRLRAHVHWQESLSKASRTGIDQMVKWADPERPAVHTVFEPELRLQALDPGSPDVAEGKRLAMEAFRAMHAELARNDVPLLVVFIPTKELVYKPLVESSPGGPIPQSLSGLWAAEEEARATLRAFLDQEGVPVVDALPVLRQRLEADVPIYPHGFDGHPEAAGYAAIADAVLDHELVAKGGRRRHADDKALPATAGDQAIVGGRGGRTR